LPLSGENSPVNSGIILAFLETLTVDPTQDIVDRTVEFLSYTLVDQGATLDSDG
jgi:hypothetical protein